MYTSGSTVAENLRKCKPKGMIEAAKDDYTIKGGARDKIIAIANQIIAIGALLSVGAIVYAGLLYVMYAGDEDRVKKAKSSLKFGIIGFVVMLLSFPIVNMIVGLIYSVGG